MCTRLFCLVRRIAKIQHIITRFYHDTTPITLIQAPHTYIYKGTNLYAARRLLPASGNLFIECEVTYQKNQTFIREMKY